MDKAIKSAADKLGITYQQCYAEIAAAIDEAWATTDPVVKQRQIELVGDSRKPSPEEFISLVTQKLLDKSKRFSYHHGMGSDR